VTRARSEGFQVSESKQGWHKLKYGEMEIDVVPEGRTARPGAPTLIPGPRSDTVPPARLARCRGTLGDDGPLSAPNCRLPAPEGSIRFRTLTISFSAVSSRVLWASTSC
jgi:hypothetical protein